MNPAPPVPDCIVRRKRDGMLGLVGRTWTYQATASNNPRITDVVWLGEWTKGDLNKAGAYDVLSGSDEEKSRVRFAALFCERCDGTGKLDPFTKCPVAECKLGRLLGVEPAFDASYERYERLLAAEIDRDRNRYSPRSDAGAEREMDLRYPSTCTECGTRLVADASALGRKESGSWHFRCLGHAA